ncbi:uncharacterized protein LOC108829643 isoform X3 [Raphanus sativus]|uniref:Uncharacterized protein LOC108829643 isoform X3 n=1 Tax=Raphanus sativus TaxID=3726 RepID=A0A9W3C8A4_RAPSA|nr:uncharacterized protein LOC108829643 isoform X3 [Raphanus sativus]
MMMMKLMIQRSHLREKQIKGNRRSQRKDKRSQKQGMLRTQVDNPDTPSQIKENRKSRRQGMRSQKQKKDSSITDGGKADATPESRKKMRQTKD